MYNVHVNTCHFLPQSIQKGVLRTVYAKRQITVKVEKINVNFCVLWPVAFIGKYDLPKQFSYIYALSQTNCHGNVSLVCLRFFTILSISGCKYQDETYKEGEEFTLPTDRCTKCVCQVHVTTNKSIALINQRNLNVQTQNQKMDLRYRVWFLFTLYQVVK